MKPLKSVWDNADAMPATMPQVKREIKALEKRLGLLRRLQGCDWKRIPWEYGHLYRCSRCKSETANLPSYRNSVCDSLLKQPRRG